MVLPPQLTISEIDELIANLDKAMDAFLVPSGNDVMKYTESPNISIARGSQSVPLREIWEQFLEYCLQNELDPDQQLREAVASYYQDVLKTFRIRTTLNLSDNPNLV